MYTWQQLVGKKFLQFILDSLFDRNARTAPLTLDLPSPLLSNLEGYSLFINTRWAWVFTAYSQTKKVNIKAEHFSL